MESEGQERRGATARACAERRIRVHAARQHPRLAWRGTWCSARQQETSRRRENHLPGWRRRSLRAKLWSRRTSSGRERLCGQPPL